MEVRSRRHLGTPRLGAVTMRVLPAASLLALVLLLTGCLPGSAPWPESGAFDESTVAAREEAAAAELALVSSIVTEPPLSTGIVDGCSRGQSGLFNPATTAWSCGHRTVWIIEDVRTDPAEILTSWRERIAAAGCEPNEADWGMTEQYWRDMGVPGVRADGTAYTVDDLPGAGARCPDSNWRDLSFSLSTPGGVDAMGTTVDGELIEAEPYDLAVVRASTSPHVVTISTSTSYHQVPRNGQPVEVEDDNEPLPCVCHSGGDCDCPGG